jgi:hypothetical protein
MNRFSASLLLVCSAACFGQVPLIKSGSTIYIEPMDGYETYLAAAIVKKHVPLVVVADKDKADYIVRSTVNHTPASQPAVVVSNSNVNNNNVNNSNVTTRSNSGGYGAALAALGSTSTSIAVVEPRSSQVVFAYAAGRAGYNQFQRTAEDCAKHMKEFIEKSEKPTK